MPLPLRLPPLVALALIAAPAAAHAESILNGAKIQIVYQLPDGEDYVDATDTTPDYLLSRQFNLARCYCAQTGIEDETTNVRVELQLDQDLGASVEEDVDIWLGQDCFTDNTEQRARDCTLLDTLPEVNDLSVPLYRVFQTDDLVLAGEEEGQSCRNESVITAGLYVAPDPTGNDTYDEPADQFTETIDLDTDPPPVPDEFSSAAGGENAIQLEWEALTSDEDDVYKWQLLCARVAPDDPDVDDGVVPALAEPSHDPRWDTAEDLCGADTGEEYVTILGGEGTLPAPLARLDAAYVCGEAEGTATSIRAAGLANGESYHVALVAVDKAGNVTGTTPGVPLEPQEVADFWESLHGSGSEVEGGFCLIAETFGDGGPTTMLRDFRDRTLAGSWLGDAMIDAYYTIGALTAGSTAAQLALVVVASPLIVIALAWQALTLPGLLALIAALVLLRRRRRAVLAIAATLTPAVASAQSFAPYWDDETEVEESGPEDVDWHAGLKLGPFLPGIDDQLGIVMGDGPDGPYDEMFGGPKVLPVLEVDRIFFHVGGGQLGAGGSAGFLSQTAPAWRFTDTNANMRWDRGEPFEKSPGDETSFRLIPLAANVVYRWTMLDDDYGVPVVPYARAGLSYYVWWMTKPNGDLSTVPNEDGSLDKARGASLGFQGSLGIAVRAERVDPTAAASMRDSGLYHAGFYAEYQIARVDGFGSEKKLSVGDDTWFAGIDFEF